MKSPENDHLDVGWNEGFLSDGRPYRIEMWAQDQITSVTVFMSTEGLETYAKEQLVELLERERIVTWFEGVFKSAYAVPWTDSAGQSMWSINVVVGADDAVFADSVAVRAYGSRPAT
ncbi:MAG TPA: hypothetical protein VN428_16785 [Bryobacteraceae bacterium]|nr:hypothetical protein [Bryobacteraceae bacterium]